MRKNFMLAICATVAVGAMSMGTANAQGANLIQNGDFSGTPSLTGWTPTVDGTVTTSTVGAYAAYGATNSGSAFTNASTFAVLPYNASYPSSLTVTFSTVAGTNYDLSFLSGFFGDALGANGGLNYSISIAGKGVVNSGSSSSGQDTDFLDLFQPMSTSIFTGNNGLATITFTSADNGINACGGAGSLGVPYCSGAAILLTDVEVQNVPEPSSFALALTGLVGLAGIGFARARGRKSI
jgi:hypothetical protein